MFRSPIKAYGSLVSVSGLDYGALDLTSKCRLLFLISEPAQCAFARHVRRFGYRHYRCSQLCLHNQRSCRSRWKLWHSVLPSISLTQHTVSFSSSPLLGSKKYTRIQHAKMDFKDKINKILLKWGDRGIFQKLVPPLEFDDSQSQLKMRYVYLTTCVDFWEDVPVGVGFDVAYVDSNPEAPYTTKNPVVVGLHGAPGSHEDLLPILEPLVTQGYRVIIPNFPGFGHTRGVGPGHDDCFTHTPEEKAVFLADLLTVIGIPRVDLLVGHSAGCYPLLQICAEGSGVQAAVMICPGVHTPYRGIQPVAVLKALSRWWEIPMLRPAVKALVYLGTRNRYQNTKILHRVVSLRTVINVDFEQVMRNIVYLEQTKFPCCVMFSDDDSNVDLSMMREFAEQFSIPADRVETFSTDTPGKSQGVTGYPKAVMLEGGGHNPMRKYCNIIISQQQQLLRFMGKGR